MLKSLGITRGDRVAIYLPLVPELAIAMLACALRDRINDAKAALLITADGGWRRGQIVPLKQMADEALTGTPPIRHVVIVQRLHGSPVPVHVRLGRLTLVVMSEFGRKAQENGSQGSDHGHGNVSARARCLVAAERIRRTRRQMRLESASLHVPVRWYAPRLV